VERGQVAGERRRVGHFQLVTVEFVNVDRLCSPNIVLEGSDWKSVDDISFIEFINVDVVINDHVIGDHVYFDFVE
jgi:hypothetical protein